MADMIARQNIPGPGGGIAEVDDLCPANQREGSSNQPPAELREKSLRASASSHKWPGEQIGILPIRQDHTRTTGTNGVRLFRAEAQVGRPFCECAAFNHQKYLFGFSPDFCHLLTLQVMITSYPQ
jgi:hypothetical protein